MISRTRPLSAVRNIAVLCVLLLGSQAAATYTVKSGDSLGKIARANGVSESSLAQANGITDRNKIKIGQVLNIPGAPAPAVTKTYTVVSGDTLGNP